MAYFLRNGSILYTNDSGEIAIKETQSIPVGYLNKTEDFTTIIKEIVLTKGNLNSDKRYIVHSELFSISGFISTFQKEEENHPIICSDFDATLDHLHLNSGSYSFIDIGIATTTIFNFTINNKQAFINNKKNIDSKSLIKSIYDSLKSYLNEGIDKDNLAKTIFNFSNIIGFNDYIKNPKFGIISNPEVFVYYPLHFDDSGYMDIFKSNMPVSIFVESIYSCICDFVNQHSLIDKSIILKSPLTGYLPVSDLLNKTKIIAISEFDLLNTAIADSRVGTNMLSCGWILSETKDLSFKLSHESNNKTQSISYELTELKKDLSTTFFSVKDMELIEYYFEIERDCCENLHLKIKTRDKKEFYQLIN